MTLPSSLPFALSSAASVPPEIASNLFDGGCIIAQTHTHPNGINPAADAQIFQLGAEVLCS